MYNLLGLGENKLWVAVQPKCHLSQHKELQRQTEKRKLEEDTLSQLPLAPGLHLPHQCVGIVAPEEGRVSGIATTEDDVHSPHKGDEVEDSQTTRVIVLSGLHLGQMKPLHCALYEVR